MADYCKQFYDCNFILWHVQIVLVSVLAYYATVTFYTCKIFIAWPWPYSYAYNNFYRMSFCILINSYPRLSDFRPNATHFCDILGTLFDSDQHCLFAQTVKYYYEIKLVGQMLLNLKLQ